MFSRLQKICKKLEEENLDGLLLSSPANITYLTEYPSRDSYLLVSRKGNLYFTDSRYTQEAKTFLKGRAQVKDASGTTFKTIAQGLADLGLKRVGFESRYLPYAEYKRIHLDLNKRSLLIPTHSLVEELRQIKDAGEIKKIREAVKICIGALELMRNFIAPGKKEIEVVAEMERFIRYQGASNSSFDTIVATGAHAAYPHHISGQRKLSKAEPVLIDAGVEFKGYKSDLTRVYFLSKMDGLISKVYDIVRGAQLKAIEEIRPGTAISKIDRAARGYIAKKGYAPYFKHNLGHGLGLEIHELPNISPKSDIELEEGMVFTIEPGIYLPGKFGIRIEDMVLVTKKGCEVLSGALNK
ncbi:MAG: Xaa-Pro peptidase family protein [Candidatus Omnitrophica bacterium]|nr:Xaa-Pro peptidase family protein [Candidatus Omnitrophota bacterium]